MILGVFDTLTLLMIFSVFEMLEMLMNVSVFDTLTLLMTFLVDLVLVLNCFGLVLGISCFNFFLEFDLNSLFDMTITQFFLYGSISIVFLGA